MDHWFRLDCKDPKLPDLLIKSRFDSSGYSILLTDLSRVWIETLPKKQIVRRAIKEDCSIDPSEDDVQFQILQGKISSATRQEDGSSCIISQHGKDGLQLQLSAPLPPPLPRFQWRVEMSLSADESVEKHIVTPLIRQAQNLYHHLDLLVAELHDKDRVISKITDRLEQSGNDLTTVFPGVSHIKTNRKRSQREQLAKHVKGLADFNEELWRSQHRTITDDEHVLSGLAKILGELPPPRTTSDATTTAEWWRDAYYELNSENTIPPAAPVSSTTVKTPPTSNVEGATETDFPNSGFQTQPTPPRRQVKPPATIASENAQEDQDVTPPAAGNDESTDDEEDDLDRPSQKPSRASQHASSTLVDRTQDKIEETQFGNIEGGDLESTMPEDAEHGGQRLSPETETAHVSSVSPKPGPRFGKIGGKSTKSAATERATDPPKRNAKLGAFGGQRQEKMDDNASRQRTTSSPVQPAPAKVGTFGGRKRHAPSEETTSRGGKVEEEEPGPPDMATSTEARSASPEEDPVKKAERKRDQLKKELEERAKVPVKKKRKF